MYLPIWLTQLYICFLELAILLAQEVQSASGPKLADFKSVLQNDPKFVEKINKLKSEVETFAEKFPLPGLNSEI